MVIMRCLLSCFVVRCTFGTFVVEPEGDRYWLIRGCYVPEGGILEQWSGRGWLSARCGKISERRVRSCEIRA